MSAVFGPKEAADRVQALLDRGDTSLPSLKKVDKQPLCCRRTKPPESDKKVVWMRRLLSATRRKATGKGKRAASPKAKASLLKKGTPF